MNWDKVKRSIDRFRAMSIGLNRWDAQGWNVGTWEEGRLAKAIGQRKWRFVEHWTMDSEKMPESAANQDSRPQKDIYEANIVTSEMENSTQHMLVLDLDCDHIYLPSSTFGHGHLMINVPMRREAALSLLEALAEHGVVQRGYAAASRARGYSAIRLPWVRKDQPEDLELTERSS